MSARYFESVWMDWMTLKGVTATPIWATPERLYLDTLNTSGLVLRSDVIEITGDAGLGIQTSPSAAADWELIATYTGLTRAALVLGTEPNSTVSMHRYLRAAVSGAGAPWSVTFRLLIATPMDAQTLARESRARSQVVVPGLRTPQVPSRMSSMEPPSKTGTALEKVPFGSTNTPRGIADGYIPVQDWITVRGGFTATSPDEIVIQAEEGWPDLRSTRYLLVESEVNAMSTCSLIVEQAFTKEGPWVRVGATLTTGYQVHPVCLSVEYAAFSASTLSSVRCWLRWHIESSADTWEACFRINAKWA